ncbi:MAG TPA: hypothetical protein PKE61_01445 [Burkholderiaceae bacterium]|nr:hypothetical protein [Burkholderiaceae bacterium]
MGFYAVGGVDLGGRSSSPQTKAGIAGSDALARALSEPTRTAAC